MSKKFAIIDGRAADILEAPLRTRGYEVLSLPCFDRLDAPVSAHPDMLLWTCGNKIVTHKDYFELTRKIFDKLSDGGYEIILSEREVSQKYPNDIALNCALLDGFIIANEKFVSPIILDMARERGLGVLHTKQGYAKCSSFLVDGSALITADESIFALCKAKGLDILKISEGNIRLDGYGYGFIGGAGGVDGDEVFFAGNPKYHPDGEKILDFCRERKKSVTILADIPLIDVGTIFFL